MQITYYFTSSIYEQHHLSSLINFAIHKTKSDTISAETVQSNLKKTIKIFVARNNAFSFLCSVKETSAYWKRFSYNVLAMVKQLSIPTYSLTLSCANLGWEELLYIINKLNNLGLSDEELQNLSYLERCNLFNDNQKQS